MLTGILAPLAVVALVGAPFALLTASGGRKRGYPAPTAFLAGLAFPVTWVLWYLQDTRRGAGVP